MDGGGGQADGDGVTTQGGALADDALVLVVLDILIVLDILVIDVNIVSGDDNDSDK